MRNPEQQQAVRVAVKVTTAMTPLCCPLPSMTLWNMHPKVYLPLDEDQSATCPYCETHYTVCDE